MLTRQTFVDWLTEPTVELVKIETPEEHLARVDARAKELREAMRDKYLCHPSNQIKRLDGKVFVAKQSNNVRPMKRKREAA